MVEGEGGIRPVGLEATVTYKYPSRVHDARMRHSSSLGRLEKVNTREAWKHEATEFTPWLAREENLSLLSETLGINLELIEEEKSVGPFRADILARDMDEDGFVLIENQLAPTDHTHLGQLLTYAAGLDTVTIVWIAERFTEQHRAALDWLNKITDDRARFFGVELELWRISNSPAAPKFNLVSKPNEWGRDISQSARGKMRSPELQDKYLRFWNGFVEYLKGTNYEGKLPEPRPKPGVRLDPGIQGLRYVCGRPSKQRIRVRTILIGPDRDTRFSILEENREHLESVFDEDVDMASLTNKNLVEIHTSASIDDENDWQRQYEWYRENLEKMKSVVNPLVAEADRHNQSP